MQKRRVVVLLGERQGALLVLIVAGNRMRALVLCPVAADIAPHFSLGQLQRGGLVELQRGRRASASPRARVPQGAHDDGRL